MLRFSCNVYVGFKTGLERHCILKSLTSLFGLLAEVKTVLLSGTNKSVR